MSTNFVNEIAKIASTDLFQRDGGSGWQTGIFIGRPFHLDYSRARILVADAWKQDAKGIPQGAFLLAYYENEESVLEALLLRVLDPARLPTDNDVVASMVEYYKDNLKTTGPLSQLDSFTKYEFSFSGLECRLLGTLYKDSNGVLCYGADVENFYSAHNYSVVKPNAKVLELIVNLREGEVTGKPTDIQIGNVRYSSSRRFADSLEDVPVYVSPQDFLGKRTALFGMTRTGKSNTVKVIIQASSAMGEQASSVLGSATANPSENLEPLTLEGFPKYPVGQIIFDINGEYANPNLQDAGTAIFEIYKDRTSRYSTLDKPGFKVMKVNFYADPVAGFQLICAGLSQDNADYVTSFKSVILEDPQKSPNWNALTSQEQQSLQTRYKRKVAAYLCCLRKANFNPPANFKVTFDGNKELNALVTADSSIDPSKGISLDKACDWFSVIWDNYKLDDPANYFAKYKRDKGKDWIDEDLKALLIMLTKKKNPGRSSDVSGYVKLRDLAGLHTETIQKPYEEDIIADLRSGRIVIVDLSQGDENIQRLYSERLCKAIFNNSMSRFIENLPNNYIQFYFEEAHNLFPKKDDKDLSQVYNRIAKEGAKLNLGMIYATQEVSSVSSNILKNTQNWFIAHLNNEDETKEIQKYYDFGDFVDSLVRFSASNDKGFVRMKTYSNPFVVPVQISKFPMSSISVQ